MSLGEQLKRYGIDFESGLVNMGGNETLYLRLLAKFPHDENYAAFVRHMEAGDMQNAKIHIHALKGLTANMAMPHLNEACRRADALLKEQKTPDNMQRIQECYDVVVSGIERLDAVKV